MASSGNMKRVVTWLVLSLAIDMLHFFTASTDGGDSSIKYCGNVTILESNLASEWDLLRHCHVIEGHLRIHRCKLPHKTPSLPNLIQVTGYILLERIEGLESLSEFFPRLSVVRGQILFKGHFAFLLNANTDLREVGPWSLRDIARGSVHVQDNILMCTDEEIQWTKLIKLKYREGNAFINNRDFCPFVGCEEEGSCTARPKTCFRTGLPCPFSTDSECHSQCIGGCYEPRNRESCVTCRKFLLGRSCVEKCPSTHLKYMDYRCVTLDYCLSNNGSVYDLDTSRDKMKAKISSISNEPKASTKSALECLKDCPEKYITVGRHELFEGWDLVRTCEPRPICESSNLHNRDFGDDLRHCKRIDGNLIIRISGGKNVTLRVEENLGAIEVVTGYVMVVGANALYSLSFLTNLTVIQGTERVYGADSREGYAFYVLENGNLREFWDFSQKRRLEINGPVFVSFNDQLCPSEVDKLANVTKRNISADFNGRKSQCEIFHSVLTAVPGTEVGTMLLSWMHNYCGVDNRYVLGYEIFFRATKQNVSFYHQRDVCNNQDLWAREVLKIPVSRNDSSCMSYVVEDLIPNTRYAFYVRSLAADTIPANTIQSNMAYNITRSIHPKKPLKGSVKFLQKGIILSWDVSPSPYSDPDQIFYEAVISVQNDSVSGQMRFQEQCQVSGKDTSTEENEEENIASFDASKALCDCRQNRNYDTILMQNQRKKNIAIEKEIDRLIFYRPSSTGSGSPKPSANRIPGYWARLSYRDKACTRMYALPGDCPYPVPDWTDSPLEFSPKIQPSWWRQKGEGKFIWSGRSTVARVLVPLPSNFDLNSQPTKLIAKVRACIGELEPCYPLNTSTPCAMCSQFALWTQHEVHYEDLWDFEVIPLWKGNYENDGRSTFSDSVKCSRNFPNEGPTEPIITKTWTSIVEELVPGLSSNSKSVVGNPKDFSNPNETVNLMNYSLLKEEDIGHPVLMVSWSLPSLLEPVALGYRLYYRVVDAPDERTVRVCLPKSVTDAQEETLYIPVTSGGQYQVGIQVRTLAGFGPINEKCILIPWSGNTELLVYLGCGVGFAMVAVVVVILFFVFRSKRNVQGEIHNKYYGVTWLEYIHSRFHLAPNQLHIKTDNLLGGGEFGLVYEGTVTKGNGCKTRVAVKTIREGDDGCEGTNFPGQTREEKIQALLKEAVIMQDFKSAFILQLEGVAEDAAGLNPVRELSLYVALEFMDGGDLKSFLNSRRASGRLLDHQEMIEISIQVADGMAYLSAKNFQHRDLAARNCMIAYRDENQLHVKIGDFGLTRYLKEDYYYFPKQNKPLPVRWMAPETLNNVFKDGKCSFWSDVWSYGVLLFEIATTGDKPYDGYSDHQEVVDQVSSGELKLSSPESCPPILTRLMNQCFKMVPRDRPSFIKLVADLIPETTEQFYEWFRVVHYHSPKSCDSVSTEACDEGFYPGSSLDASQEISDYSDPHRVFTQERQRRRKRKRNHNNNRSDSVDEDICLTPRATDSCWTLPCGPHRLAEKRKFSFSSDALLYH